MNTERERAYYDEWDEAALRDIIQRQRKITETSKKLEMKKLYQVLIICDDFADSPQLHKVYGALDTLFIRGRRLQISTWVSSQKLRLISAAVRVNQEVEVVAAPVVKDHWDGLGRLGRDVAGVAQRPEILPGAVAVVELLLGGLEEREALPAVSGGPVLQLLPPGHADGRVRRLQVR